MTTNPYDSPKERSDSVKVPARKWNFSIEFVLLLGVLALLFLMVTPRRFFSGGTREAARRMGCTNNLHNIALALHRYEAAYGSLPPAYTVDAAGRPLHSWRTLILPFVEQKALYDKIDLGKPWDDPANQEAYKTRVRLYECPSNELREDRTTHTTYLAVVAPGGCFQPTESTPIAAVKDRRDLVLMVIEVAQRHAVHWMSPQDETEEAILDREPGQFSHPGGSQAAFVDGHIEFLTENIRPDALRALISIAGNDDAIAVDHF